MIDIVTKGLPPQEIADRLMNGWQVFPNVKLSGASVATLDDPNPANCADVWVLFPPGPVMPQLAVMARMVQAADLHDKADQALDWMAANLFNTTLEGIRLALEAGRKAVEDANETDARPE